MIIIYKDQETNQTKHVSVGVRLEVYNGRVHWEKDYRSYAIDIENVISIEES